MVWSIVTIFKRPHLRTRRARLKLIRSFVLNFLTKIHTMNWCPCFKEELLTLFESYGAYVTKRIYSVEQSTTKLHYCLYLTCIASPHKCSIKFRFDVFCVDYIVLPCITNKRIALYSTQFLLHYTHQSASKYFPSYARSVRARRPFNSYRSSTGYRCEQTAIRILIDN